MRMRAVLVVAMGGCLLWPGASGSRPAPERDGQRGRQGPHAEYRVQLDRRWQELRATWITDYVIPKFTAWRRPRASNVTVSLIGTDR